MNIYEDINRIKEVMGLIVENEKNNIRSMYGIVNEQTITLPLPISDTFQSYDGDSAHKLTGLETKIDVALKQIYNQGINPKMYDVKLKVVRNGNTFTTTSSLMIDKSDDGKAWTGFASRGSIGYDYVNRADGQIDGSGNADGRSLEEKLKSGADAVEIIPISNSPITINNVQLKQYFVQFTKSLKPSHTSSKPNPPTNNITTLKSSGRDLNSLNANFKKVVSDFINQNGDTIKNYNVKNFTITPNRDSVESSISLIKDKNGYNGFSILFNPKGQPQESKNNALSKNLDSKIIKNGVINFPNEYEYHLIGLHV